MRAPLAEAHSKLIEQSETLSRIYSICRGLERDVTVIVSGRLSGAIHFTDSRSINPNDVAETEADSADGLAGADPTHSSLTKATEEYPQGTRWCSGFSSADHTRCPPYPTLPNIALM
jgi:hypothetical protein